MQYTTNLRAITHRSPLFYQDFKDTFVCNTQRNTMFQEKINGCFIRISKILLYAIHNEGMLVFVRSYVVLSGFQRYFCMQYTTGQIACPFLLCCFIRISEILLYAIHNFLNVTTCLPSVVLSGFQRYFCMQYTTR